MGSTGIKAIHALISLLLLANLVSCSPREILLQLQEAPQNVAEDAPELQDSFYSCLDSCMEEGKCQFIAVTNEGSCSAPPPLIKRVTCKHYDGDITTTEDRRWCVYSVKKPSEKYIPKVNFTEIPSTCEEVEEKGANESGVYVIAPDTLGLIKVYCRIKKGEKTKTVVQRREDGSVDFFRNWEAYKKGFGYLRGEFWVGNEYLWRMTRNATYDIEFYMEASDGEAADAMYSTFVIEDESAGYRVSYDRYIGGIAGDSLIFAKDMKFSTYDRDNDNMDEIEGQTSCAVVNKGGWWYNNCHACNPNGLYLNGTHDSYGDGIEWLTFRGMQDSLSFFEMRLVPKMD